MTSRLSSSEAPNRMRQENIDSRRDLKPDNPPTHFIRRLYWIGLGMHIGLVGIHLALMATLYAGHLENRITVDLGNPANIASVAIVVVSQVVNQVRLHISTKTSGKPRNTTYILKVYLVSLVLIVQQLALRRILRTRQTLTAVHDHYDAWSGFGAALTTLNRQADLPSSVWGISAVAAYLLAVSALHVTVPSTFSLATFNKSIPGTVYLKNNVPDLGDSGMQYVHLNHIPYVLHSVKYLLLLML